MINVFCSSVYNMEEYETLKKQCKTNLSLADHNLNYNIIKGMDLHTDQPTILVNSIPIPSYPSYPLIFMKKRYWKHNPAGEKNDIHLGCINLPVLKQLTRRFTCYRALRRLVKENPNEKINVLVYDLHLPLVKAIIKLKRKFPQVNTCAVLPDIPDTMIHVVFGENPSKAARYYTEQKMQAINQFDSYVFVTELMKEKVDVSEKPYVVVEGIYDSRFPLVEAPEESEKRIILYSGALREAYGVKRLTDLIAGLNNPNYELWLCGGGELTQYVTEKAKESESIKYFGYVSSERIHELQQQATVLINPRKNDAEYTKYSFPSKTMEYLASGKPMIGYRLDGYPKEYAAYIFCPADESDEALREKIIEVCSMSREARDEHSKQSRAFILNEKSPKAQCAKIIEMLRKQ